MSEVVVGLAYLHTEMKIMHRDLKADNFLLESGQVKIADFGVASRLKDVATATPSTPAGTTPRVGTVIGSPLWMAPEMIEEGICAPPVDVWSLGVILYILLCGFPPFYGDNDAQMFKMIKAGSFKFLKPYWDPISQDAKDFVSQMLVVDVTKRATIPSLLQHAWLKDLVAAEAKAAAEEMVSESIVLRQAEAGGARQRRGGGDRVWGEGPGQRRPGPWWSS